eukprot:509321-Prymnesium_polylepis.1
MANLSLGISPTDLESALTLVTTLWNDFAIRRDRGQCTSCNMNSVTAAKHTAAKHTAMKTTSPPTAELFWGQSSHIAS